MTHSLLRVDDVRDGRHGTQAVSKAADVIIAVDLVLLATTSTSSYCVTSVVYDEIHSCRRSLVFGIGFGLCSAIGRLASK